jgi:hypothetical protein
VKILTCCTLLKNFYSHFPRDCIFGPLDTAFSHKWNGYGFAHPLPLLLPQAILMARLAAKENSLSYTILINIDPNWHQHNNPFYSKFLNMHAIVYIPPNTLQYHEPIKPIYDDKSYIVTQAIKILCIHHKTTPIGDILSLKSLIDNTLNTNSLFQIAPPTPPNTNVHKIKIWHTLPDPTFPMQNNNHIPLPFYLNIHPNTIAIQMYHSTPSNNLQQIHGNQKLPHTTFIILLKIYKYLNNSRDFKTN